tara:strand:- start:259 stop:477 length:219 start_codon:yes stop_codon:yes gene_type:complete
MVFIELFYVYFLFICGYIFLYAQVKIIENEYINYRLNTSILLNKINDKFELFDGEEIQSHELMNKALDNIII